MTNTFSLEFFSNQGGGNSPVLQWNGGRGVLQAAGNFSGATLTMFLLGPNSATFLPVKVMDSAGVQTTVTLTDNGMILFELPQGLVRVVISGGTPTNMYVRADRVPY